MSRVPDRGSLTDALITQLETIGFPVGDAAAPLHDPAAALNPGWNGEPNAPGSTYVPYLVLTPQTATISSGPFSAPQADFRIPYALSTFGLHRKQAESLAHRARVALEDLGNTTYVLDGTTYKVQQIWFDAIGGVGRIDATEPPTFGEVDTFTVWLTQ